MSRSLPLVRWSLSNFVLATMLVLCAGQVSGAMTAYLLIFAGTGLVTVLVADASQDGERRNPGPAAIDPGSRLVASSLFLTTALIAALDTGRFRWTHAVSPTNQLVALAVLILAGGLQVWAMKANLFFSTAVRIQAERGHELVTHGPYRFVRHPGYLAMAVIMPATALTLGSLIALIPALSYSALILHRIVREDRFLREKLRGYARYAETVHYRIIPGLW